MPPSSQLNIGRLVTAKSRDYGTKAEALTKADGEGGSILTDGPGDRPHRTNLKDNILRSSSAGIFYDHNKKPLEPPCIRHPPS